MSATIKFDGTFQAYFTGVEPSDVTLDGAVLKIKGRRIPIGDKYLYSAIEVFSYAALKKRSEIKAIIESDGNMQYTDYCSDTKADFFANKILGFGTQKTWYHLRQNVVPSESTHKDGNDYYYMV